MDLFRRMNSAPGTVAASTVAASTVAASREALVAGTTIGTLGHPVIVAVVRHRTTVGVESCLVARACVRHQLEHLG